MSSYEVAISEVEEGAFVGEVFLVEANGDRTSIGYTRKHGMKPTVTAEAKDIARRHRDDVEVIPLDLD